MSHKQTFAAFAAVLTLAASVAAGAALAQPPRPMPAAAPQAADQTLGIAIMSAFVSSTGELVEGAGVVSSVRNTAGRYTVKFNRALAGCVSTATLWGNAYSIIAVYPQGDTVNVGANNPANGNPTDENFQLIVFCSK